MMNLALPEMMLRHMDSPRTLAVAGECIDMNVLEKQRARFKWHQEYQQPSALGVQKCSFRGSDLLAGFCDELVMSGPGDCCGGGTAADSVLADMVNRQLKVDPGFQNGWPEFGGFDIPGAAFENCGYGTGTGSETNRSVSRTSSFLPPCTAAETTPVVAADTGGGGSEKAVASQVGRESFKKRKREKAKSSKVEDDTKAKKRRGSAEDGESKVTTEHNNEKSSNNSNRETSATTSKDNSRVSEVQKPDYIHVRARRGQATDSHSLAERARREKISERMKYLQDLVPGCNKITGKAGMLDEIINYVQSLQRQVEFLSMKLAAVTPSVDFNINSLFAKEMFPNSTASFPGTIDLPTELTNAAFIHFNPAQNQVVSCSAMQSEVISNANAQRTMGCPMPIAETSFDSSCFNNSLAWNFDIPNLFDYQGRSTNSFEPAQFTGPVEASNLKMEI